ncbi:MAG: amidohydrolase family protein [Peptococcaceae bacterium]|jgi:imidazolonepropionase-like amidohydrolase|nr:amidohydrolase family protein [Peptococcaceae bacterium]
MLYFKNAFLVDGTGQNPQEGITVVVQGKTIVQVGRDISIPEDAQVIDLKGKPLLPGFSDAHTHLGGSDSLDRPGLSGRFASYDYAQNREAALEWGVTAVRSAGDFTPEILEFRDEVNEGKIRSPRILACGRFIQAQNGHPGCTVFSADQNILDNAMVLVNEQTDIETEVKKLVDAGVDLIKTVISDDNKMDYPNSAPRLSNEQLRRIADAAHKYGKRLMVHVDDLKDMADAVAIGADTIEHTIDVGSSNHELTDELLKALTSRDVWVVPSMIATKNHDVMPGIPPVYAILEEVVREFVQAGVKIGVGCDSGIPFVPYGECVHLEMELLTHAGMSPLAAITAATGGNAKMFGQEHIFGTVEPGKAADLVVLGSNPLQDIKNTRDIKMVLRDGRIMVDKLLSN